MSDDDQDNSQGQWSCKIRIYDSLAPNGPALTVLETAPTVLPYAPIVLLITPMVLSAVANI